MATVLVTGGGGYIGSHACKALAVLGHRVVTLDNFSTGWRDAVRYGPAEPCDLTDRDAVHSVLQRHRPDAIMHFAALSDIGQSVREPARYWRTNVQGSINLLDAAVAAGVPHLVMSSTCAVYGEQDGVLDEGSPTRPSNTYGATKLAVEQMLESYAAAGGPAYVTFRYFNVAGADEGREIGEHHRPETHLIPRAIEALRGGSDVLTINGTDWPTPDGTCIRDFVHVEDLVEAHVAGLDYLRGGGRERIFNLGTGNGFSVREVVEAVGRVGGTPVPVAFGPRRPGDCARLVSGSRKAADILGWSARRSTLERMIGDAWAWHQRPGYAA